MSQRSNNATVIQQSSKLMLAQSTFRQVVKQELEILLQNGVERKIAVKQLLLRIVAMTIQPSEPEIDEVMEQFQLNRDDAIRALIVKKEIGRLKTQGFESLDAIQELTRRLQCRQQYEEKTEGKEMQGNQMNDSLCQQIGNVSISTSQRHSESNPLANDQEQAQSAGERSCHSADLLSRKRKNVDKSGQVETIQTFDFTELQDFHKDETKHVVKKQKRAKSIEKDDMKSISLSCAESKSISESDDKCQDLLASHSTDSQLHSVEEKQDDSKLANASNFVDSMKSNSVLTRKKHLRRDRTLRPSCSPESEQDYKFDMVSKQKRPYTMVSSEYDDHDSLFCVKHVEEEHTSSPYEVHHHSHHPSHTFHHHNTYLRHSKRHRK